MEENNIIIETQETTETVEVDSIDSFVVEVSEVSTTLDNSNDMSVHGNLSGLTDPDQHPISAITGLRAELNALNTAKTPQTLYSNKGNIANYYKWKDATYDTYGYFVSLVPGESTIKICDGSDIFGVSVETAGFIGNQEAEVTRDNSYGLIVTSGLVDVRCASDVVVGDYVVCGNLPNQAGVATKTESGCGYKVIAIEDKNGVNYASISLDVQACTTDVLGARVENVENDLTSVKTSISQMSDRIANVDGAINDIKDYSDQARADASNASSKADDASNKAKNAVDVAGSAVTTANIAQAEASALREKAVTAANQALAGVESVEGRVDKLIANVDKFSVGEHSQSYGLTINLARDILTEGMIYIPIGDNIKEMYTFEYNVVIDEDGKKSCDRKTFVKEFTQGNYYEWKNNISLQIDGINATGFWWNEHQGKVWYLGTVADFELYDYWFPNDSDVAEGYKKQTLYVKTNVADEGETASYQWVEEACLVGNANNRLVGLLRSDTDSINLELSNARGDAVTLQQRLDADGARFSLAASKVTEIDGVELVVAGRGYETLNELEGEVDAGTVTPNGSEGVYYLVGVGIPYDVYWWNGTEFVLSELLHHDGINFCSVNSAAIVGAVNNTGDTSLKFSADRIDFTAGDFEINASNIKFDCADEYYLDANHITFGAEEFNIYPIIDGKVQTQEEANFSVDTNGNVSIKGEVHADSGEIAGWTIASDRISKDKTGIYTGTGYNDDGKTEENNEFLFDSLIDGAPKSPVRFYAGKSNLLNEVEAPERLRFTTDTLKELTQTIDMDSGDIPFYDYVDATVLTTTKEHKAVTYTKTISIASGSTLIEGSETYYSITPQELSGFLPADLTKEHVTLECKLHDAESTADLTGVHLEYTGNGAVILDGYMSVANATMEVDVEAVFDYTEQIDARAEFTNTTELKQIKVMFTPKLVNVNYDIDIEYTMILTGEAGYQFKVLEDGSLYAGNVELNGRVYATGGSIGGWDIDEASMSKSNDTTGMMVGMLANNTEYYSLKNDGEKSVVRFYVGEKFDDNNKLIDEGSVVVSFDAVENVGDTTSAEIVIPSADHVVSLADDVYYHENIYTSEKLPYSFSTFSDISQIVDTTSDLILTKYYGFCIVTFSLPTWLPSEATPTIVVNSTSGAKPMSCIYLGGGRVRLSSTTIKSGVSYIGTVQLVFQYVEELNIKLSAPETKASGETVVIAELTPQTLSAYQNVEFNYVKEAKSEFMVLEDGSLYANNAKITGEIHATDGSFEGEFKAKTGSIGGLTITGNALQSDGYKLNSGGIHFIDDSASLMFGDNFAIQTEPDHGSIVAYNTLKVGSEDTYLAFNSGETEETVTKEFYLYGKYLERSSLGGNRKIGIMLSDPNKTPTYYRQDLVIKWTSYKYTPNAFNANMKKIDEGSWTITWNKNLEGQEETTSQFWFTYDNKTALDVVMLRLGIYLNDELLVSGSFDTYVHEPGENDWTQLSENAGAFTQSRVVDSAIKSTGSLVPSNDSAYDLGYEDKGWWNNAYINNAYVKDHPNVSSDRHKKNSIQPLSKSYEQIFDALEPVSYKFNQNNSNRTHIGLIAQDVKAAVESAGLTTQDFAGYCEWEKEDGTIECGLRYGEFIALCIDEIQKLKKRVEELEKEKNE